MRRLDLRPLRKLRNPGSNLRSLALWAERIVGNLLMQAPFEGERLWRFRVPVFARLDEPLHATVETQRACMLRSLRRRAGSPPKPRREASKT